MKNMSYNETISNLGATVFKNKILQLKVVDINKTQHHQPYVSPPINPIETRILEVVKEGTTYVAGLVFVYMTADALRQIAIYTAMTKIK